MTKTSVRGAREKIEGARHHPFSGGWYVSAVVAIGFIALTPPASLAPLFSPLEVALGVLALAAVVSLAGIRKAPRSVFVPIPVLVLVAMMVASTLWSSVPVFTFRDATSHAVLALAAWLLARAGSVADFIYGIIGAGLVVLAGSLLLAVVDPIGALQWSSKALEGVYANRNQLGLSMLLCIPAAIAFPWRRRGGVLIRLTLVSVFLGAIIASQSKTSLIAALALIGAWALAELVKLSRWFLLAVPIGLVSAGVLAVANWSALLETLGKDATLNGRTPIWDALMGLIAERPIFGWGFLREWPGGSSQSIAVAENFDQVQIIHAHNEVLSWLSALGVVGLAVIIAIYALLYWCAAQSFRKGAYSVFYWSLFTALVLNINGLTSTSETKSQGWFLLIAALTVAVRGHAGHVPRWLVLSNEGVWHRDRDRG